MTRPSPPCHCSLSLSYAERQTTDFTVEIATATAAVAESFRGTEDPRLRAVLESLTRHLHAFVREIEPTTREWEAAIGFHTTVGHTP
ncbi:dioxygenase [Streptomyces sp. NPDC001480]|uniref:dioxygenase n=1 Tax=Streptomyces sp. NPDC001480 TaxID=3364577 RepID=UPI0036AFDB6F